MVAWLCDTFKIDNLHLHASHFSFFFALIVRYSQEQLYSVVAAVDLYSDFVPWCQKSDIVRSFPDGSFDAELEIGFKFLVERYMSHVELSKPKYVKVGKSSVLLFVLSVYKIPSDSAGQYI